MAATYVPTLPEFLDMARKEFAYLPTEFNLLEKPLPDREPINPFQVRYASEKVLVIVEGYDWGYAAGVALGPIKNPLGSIERAVPFFPLLELRQPELLEAWRNADGQLGKLQVSAMALRSCATDVLSGDLTVLATVADMLVQSSRSEN